jgi:hypothetical protein
MKLELDKVEGRNWRWVLNVSLSKTETSAIWIYFIPPDCCLYLIFIFQPAREIWTK